MKSRKGQALTRMKVNKRECVREERRKRAKSARGKMELNKRFQERVCWTTMLWRDLMEGGYRICENAMMEEGKRSKHTEEREDKEDEEEEAEEEDEEVMVVLKPAESTAIPSIPDQMNVIAIKLEVCLFLGPINMNTPKTTRARPQQCKEAKDIHLLESRDE